MCCNITSTAATAIPKKEEKKNKQITERATRNAITTAKELETEHTWQKS